MRRALYVYGKHGKLEHWFDWFCHMAHWWLSFLSLVCICIKWVVEWPWWRLWIIVQCSAHLSMLLSVTAGFLLLPYLHHWTLPPPEWLRKSETITPKLHQTLLHHILAGFWLPELVEAYYRKTKLLVPAGMTQRLSTVLFLMERAASSCTEIELGKKSHAGKRIKCVDKSLLKERSHSSKYYSPTVEAQKSWGKNDSNLSKV